MPIIHLKLSILQFEVYNRQFEMYNWQFEVYYPHFKVWKIEKIKNIYGALESFRTEEPSMLFHWF